MSEMSTKHQRASSLLADLQKKLPSLENYINDPNVNAEIVIRARNMRKRIQADILDMQAHVKHLEKDLVAVRIEPETVENILSSFQILKSRIDVLSRSNSHMRVKVNYKDRKAFATLVARNGSAYLNGPHTLPLFIPLYMENFKFPDLDRLLMALTQVFECYFRRKRDFDYIQNQYCNILLHESVERDLTCTCVEFSLRIATGANATESGFFAFKIIFPLDHFKAERIVFSVMGSEEFVNVYENSIAKKCLIFKEKRFKTAFEILFKDIEE